MANKTLFSSIKSKFVRTDTYNEAGGRAYKFTPKHALAQIAATFLLIHLFSFRNFAVGTTYSKTEVIQVALLGLILLGDTISLTGVLAISLGMGGIVDRLSRPVKPVATPAAAAPGAPSGTLLRSTNCLVYTSLMPQSAGKSNRFGMPNRVFITG